MASKELTALKAIELLKKLKQNNIDDQMVEDMLLHIIEQDIKRYELIKNDKYTTTYKNNGEYTLRTLEKALEIIKTKHIDIDVLELSADVLTYNKNPFPKITQEEFDLLKEVLEDE